MSPEQLAEAVAYNKARPYTPAAWRTIQAVVGAVADGIPGPQTARVVAAWQQQQGLTADGKVGPATYAAALKANQTALAVAGIEWRQLNRKEVMENVALTAIHESGSRPDAINLNAEYYGGFDTPKKDSQGKTIPWSERRHHPGFVPFWASRYGSSATHIGPSGGYIQHTLDGGSFGNWFEEAFRIDESAVRRIIGPHADEVLRVANAKGTARPAGGQRVDSKGRLWVEGDEPGFRSVRVRPIGGHDLWRGPWPDRLRELLRSPAGIEAQLLVAGRDYFLPMSRLLLSLKITWEPAHAVAGDIAVQYGKGWAEPRIRDVAKQYQSTLAPLSGTQQLEFTRALIGRLPQGRRARRERVMAGAEQHVHYTGIEEESFR